jgi:hypothetical protein
MDLIDNYLNAIRWNLPRAANADDVIAELRDVIASRVEDCEESLSRPLDRDETSAILRDFGHPLVVAARYGTQQWLIGPDLFPFYLFSLKVVVALSALLLVISAVADAAFSGHVTLALIHSANGAFWTLLGNAGLVTLIFAVIERTGWLADHLKQWKPEALPDLRDFAVKPHKAWESVFEIAVGIGFILWWAGLIHVPLIYTDIRGLTLTPAPIFTTLWAPILALMIARLIYTLVQFLRPRWRSARAVLSVATAAGWLTVLALIYRAGHWIVVSSATLPAGRVAEVDRSTNLGVHYAIIVFGVVSILQCAKELWQLRSTR